MMKSRCGKSRLAGATFLVTALIWAGPALAEIYNNVTLSGDQTFGSPQNHGAHLFNNGGTVNVGTNTLTVTGGNAHFLDGSTLMGTTGQVKADGVDINIGGQFQESGGSITHNTGGAAVNIGANIESNREICIYNGSTATLTAGKKMTAPDINFSNGGTLILENGTSLDGLWIFDMGVDEWEWAQGGPPLLQLNGNSTINMSASSDALNSGYGKGAYFRDGGTVDVGTNTLTITGGDAYFLDGSTLTGTTGTVKANNVNINIGGQFPENGGANWRIAHNTGGAAVNIGANIESNAEICIYNGSTAILATNKKMTAPDINFSNGGTLILENGTSLDGLWMFDMGVDEWEWAQEGPPLLQLNGNSAIIMNATSDTLKSGYSKGAYFRDGGTVDVRAYTLTITGDAYFANGSTYKFAEGGKIAVSGKATIGGNDNGSAIVDDTTLPAPKIILTGSWSPGDTVLTAGSFETKNAFSNSLFSFKTDGESLLLDQYLGSASVIDDITAATGSGTTGNYATASILMDKIITSPKISAGLKDRLTSTLQKISAVVTDNPALTEIALKQLIGEEALTAANAYHDTLTRISSTLGSRLQVIRGNNAPAAGYGPSENRVWAGGFGQWSRQGNTDNVYGYDYNAAGVMLGYDREVAAVPGLTLGLSGSWASGTLENNDGLAETDIRTFGLGVYGVYEFGNGFFLDADLGYGHAKNEAEIDLALGGRKTSDFSSNSFQAGLNVGYDVRLGEAATLTPSVGLRYTHIKQNSWQEKIDSDPDNMAVANWFGDSKQNFVEIPLNLKLTTDIETSGGAVISPEIRVGGVIAANKPESELRMGFVGSGESAVIHGIDPGRNRFTAGAGIKVQVNDTVDIFANYDLETRSGYNGHSASIGLGFSF